MSDIAELFARDPSQLTKADISEIVEKYRAARQLFVLGAKSAGAAKKIKEPALKIENLDDLLKDL